VYAKSVGAVASADQVFLQTKRAGAMAIFISTDVTKGAFTIALIKYHDINVDNSLLYY
jgi:hypothetical protein